MPAPKINELTESDIVLRYPQHVWKRAANQFVIPDALSGKYVCAVGVVTNVELTDAQEVALQDAIEQIAGVQIAKVVIGSSRLSLDRLPADTPETDYQFRVGFEMGFTPAAVEIEP